MRAEIVVVGGGVMGTSIAMHAAPRLDPIEEPLVLVERSALASGSSGRSGAILRQHYADRVVARMARDSLREYATFEQRTGRSVGFRNSGVMTLAGPAQPEWLARLRSTVDLLQEIGVDSRLVDAAEIRKLIPGIAIDDGVLGAWEAGGGFVDPRKTVEEFAALARSHGAITRLGVELQSIDIQAGAVVGVETSEGRIDTQRVVLVAGPWSHDLLRRSGIDLPLRTVRPEQHFLDMPREIKNPHEVADPILDLALGAEELGRKIETEEPAARLEREAMERLANRIESAHPVFIDLEYGYYSRCEPELLRTRIGHIDYDSDAEVPDPDQLDEEVGPAMGEWAREALAKRMPVYAQEKDAHSEAAWYTLTPDSQAMIGPVPEVQGLLLVSGFSGHGFKLAPSVGRGVTEMLFGERVTAFDPKFFDPSRFGSDVNWGQGAFGL